MTEANGKADRFRVLAEKRVSRVLTTIRRIGNLGRRNAYQFTDEQVAKMFKAMRDELDAAEAKFAPPVKKPRGQAEVPFTLTP